MIPIGSPTGAELVAARGGWTTSAEQGYVRAEWRRWAGLASFAAWSWLWVVVWASGDTKELAMISAVIAVPLSIKAMVDVPRARPPGVY